MIEGELLRGHSVPKFLQVHKTLRSDLALLLCGS
jgi:hypothetical protein